MNFIIRTFILIATILGLSRVAKKYLLSAEIDYELPENIKKILTKIQTEANRVDQVITDAIEEGKKTFKLTEEELTQEFENDIEIDDKAENDN
jgi:Na+-transporting methylmalonyl-CoA/oxaloacetate decarboxylase gamma subunit